MPWHPRKSTFGIALAVVCAGSTIIGLAVFECWRAYRLQSAESISEATVTETQVWSTSGGMEYQLRYSLEIGGARYGYQDATGRTSLWATVPEADWQKARATKRVPVRYVRDAPSINAPSAAQVSWGDHVAGGVLGVILLCCGTVAPLVERRSLQRGRPSPLLNQRRFPGKAMFWVCDGDQRT